LQFEEDAVNYVKMKYYPGNRIFLKPNVVPHIFGLPEESSSEGEQ